MLNKEEILFAFLIVFFGILYLIQLFAIGYLIMENKKQDKKEKQLINKK